ncbi:MAG: hypothetical protein IJB83_04400 [Bacilli bacterium]|nr:hypothetical protein [Bacilli bacterium]
MLKNEKSILLGKLIAPIGIILFIILLIILITILKVKPKTYNIEKLEILLPKEYASLHLEEMDHFDVLELFGFEKYEVEDAVYLKSFQIDENGNNITENINYIIVMNTENYEHYYEIFESHIESTLIHSEDEKELNLYNKAITKCDKNYVYIIISDNALDIEKTINEDL